MAITKIKPVKSTLDKAIDYIMDEDKTDGKLLVSSYGCSPETADIEFSFTISQAMQKGNNLAHHLIQSFSPDESKNGQLSPEKAHEIGCRLAKEVTNGEFEYVVTTHIDRDHIHNHILFCAVDFVHHRKYVSNKKSYQRIREISDNLCREYGLSVIIPGQEKGRSFAEYRADKNGGSVKQKLRNTIDMLIPQAKNLDDLLAKLAESGYAIKRGKYISCRGENQTRYIRLKTLGINYSEAAISGRIDGTWLKTLADRGEKIGLLIDLERCIQAQQNKGYEQWAKKFNLKQAAQTMNFLTENHITDLSQLNEKIHVLQAKNDQLQMLLKDNEEKKNELFLLMKIITVYQETKGVYDTYMKVQNKREFRAKHEGELLLHQSAKRTLQAVKHTSLPDLQQLEGEIRALKQERTRLYREYRDGCKKLDELDVVKRNVEAILAEHKDVRAQEKELEK